MNWIERKILGFFVKTKGIFSAPFLAGKGLIFMLHRVLPEGERNQYTLNLDLAITPNKLEEFIFHFKQKGYTFISLDDLSAWFNNSIKLKQKFVCLTFDDGYRDNLIHALPILRKHQVPATIYITNCLPNGTGILWWYLFEEHAKKTNTISFQSSLGTKEYQWGSTEEAHAQFGAISETIKAIPCDELLNVLMCSFGKTAKEFEVLCSSVSLSWEEITALSQDPLITIGAHTMNHISTKQQTAECVEHEMRASKKEIEEHIGKEVKHFAYPYGGAFDVSQRDLELAMNVGYETSTLNQPGNIFKRNRKQRQALARMPLGNATDWERIAYYMNGIYHFSVNGFKKEKYD
jgi:peptidoglycan/xylan/chitin deacetylase (PgdA/CDA1 family)